MRARMHSYGLAVVAGMLPGRHVGVAGLGDRVLASSTLHAGYVCMWTAARMRSPDASDKCVGKVGILLRACLVIVLHHTRPTCTGSAAPQAGKVTRSEK